MAKLKIINNSKLNITGNTRLIINESKQISLKKKYPELVNTIESFTPEILLAFDNNKNPHMLLSPSSYVELKILIPEEFHEKIETGIIVGKHHRSNNYKSGKTTNSYLDYICRQEGVQSKRKKKKIKGLSILWNFSQVYKYDSYADKLYYRTLRYEQHNLKAAQEYQKEHAQFVEIKLADEISDINGVVGYEILGSKEILKNIYSDPNTSKDKLRNYEKDNVNTLDCDHRFYFFGLIFRVRCKDEHVITKCSKYSIRTSYVINTNTLKAGLHLGYYGRRTKENELKSAKFNVLNRKKRL